jgi:hypothetical protein
VKKLFYILTFATVLYSCNDQKNNQKISNSLLLTSDTTNVKQKEIGDSIYKIGEFLFEAKKDAKFEFINKGEKPKLKTKGDTLYSDNQIVLLGNIQEIVSSGIYKKFKFKSKWDGYEVDKIYKGKLRAPNFSTDPDSKHFVTRIKEGCKETGVNFAGHYTIVEWGCGALCQEMAIVDRITGQIIYSHIPFDTVDGHSGTNYKIDSRMLIINTEALSEFDEYESGYRRFDSWRKPAVYELINSRLKQIE